MCPVTFPIVTSSGSICNSFARSSLNVFVFPTIFRIRVCFRFPPAFQSRYTGRFLVLDRPTWYGNSSGIDGVTGEVGVLEAAGSDVEGEVCD